MKPEPPVINTLLMTPMYRLMIHNLRLLSYCFVHLGYVKMGRGNPLLCLDGG